MGKQSRFFEDNRMIRSKAIGPTQYQESTSKHTSSYHKVSFGVGSRADSISPKKNQSPGPVYNSHLINNLGYVSPYKQKQPSPGYNSFGHKYDKWDKVIYRGQEKHLYGREGQGPGAYDYNHDTISMTASRLSLRSGLGKVRL